MKQRSRDGVFIPGSVISRPQYLKRPASYEDDISYRQAAGFVP